MSSIRRIASWFGLVAGELRLAARTLSRAKAFSLAVIVTLALCLGPNTAVFSALYSLLLKPLPYPGGGRLYNIANVNVANGTRYGGSLAQFADFQANADLFDGFTIIGAGYLTLDGPGVPTLRVETHPVTANVFRFLGLQPVLGRLFVPEDGTEGHNDVAVVGEEFWRTRLEADPTVVGRSIQLEGRPFTIIGVAPRSIDALMRGAAFFLPMVPRPEDLAPDGRYLGVGLMIGRLKPGVELKAAEAQLRALEGRFRAGQLTPRLRDFLSHGELRFVFDPTQNLMIGYVANQIWMLQAGALLVLLIAGVNVMNLFLARTTAKAPELAVRIALGAGRGALLHHMMAECVLLVVAAMAVGLGLAYATLAVFNWYLPQVAHAAPDVTLNPIAVASVLAVALGLALVVGAAPLWLIGRLDLRLGSTARIGGSRRGRALGGLLVVAQVAIAVTLLAGAGLLVRSYIKLTNVDAGFDAARVASARIALPRRYKTPADLLQLRGRITDAMRSIPGVESAATTFSFAVGPVRAFRETPFSLEGESSPANASRRVVYVSPVSPGYFSTMGIRILEGRGFTEADSAGADAVVIVDQAFARRYFPDRIAIGQPIALGRDSPPNGKWPRIIGVAARANLTGRSDRDGVPFVYLPMTQMPTMAFDVVLRSSRPFPDLLQDMRRKLREIDPEVPLYGESTLQQKLDSLMADRTCLTLLLGIFAALALLLAAVGLYGVLAYDVTQRTREIGIRNAIGASQGQIIGLILRQGAVRTGFGLVGGLAGALYLTRFLKSQLFDVPTLDPIAYAVVVLVLSLVALLACWIPARRAAKVDPMIALRVE